MHPLLRPTRFQIRACGLMQVVSISEIRQIGYWMISGTLMTSPLSLLMVKIVTYTLDGIWIR